MKKRHIDRKVVLLICLLIVILVVFSIFKLRNTRLLNEHSYNDLKDGIELASPEFKSQADFRNYLTTWADQQGLKYSIDESKNIIFEHEASKLKSKLAPTVVIVSYNYETANSNRRILASAASIANTDLEEAGKYTVIFVNNKRNNGDAYLNLDKKYFVNNAKVIYLDYGGGAYISTSSFTRRDTKVALPGATEDVKYDTAVKIKVEGIPSDVISANVSNHNNPISYLGTILLRLRTKSIASQISELKVEDNGNMFPTSFEVTIIMNSYNLASFTSYLDSKIETFYETYDEEDYPDAHYSYEVLDSSSFPSYAYSDDTKVSLTTLLYTVIDGNYRFEEDESIPEEFDVGSIYGINCLNKITVDDDNSIYVNIATQALNDYYMKLVMKDNRSAIKLSSCSIVEKTDYPAFSNEETGLSKTLKSTYFKVNTLSGTDMTLREAHDTYFTPMTYLAMLDTDAEIVHVKESSKTAKVVTNMILCYIVTKGDYFSL